MMKTVKLYAVHNLTKDECCSRLYGSARLEAARARAMDIASRNPGNEIHVLGSVCCFKLDEYELDRDDEN